MPLKNCIKSNGRLTTDHMMLEKSNGTVAPIREILSGE